LPLYVRCLLTMPVMQNLKRIEVIEDDESEIIEAVRRMSDRYDFVVTRYDCQIFAHDVGHANEIMIAEVLAQRKH
jgi:hypothetical protein